MIPNRPPLYSPILAKDSPADVLAAIILCQTTWGSELAQLRRDVKERHQAIHALMEQVPDADLTAAHEQILFIREAVQNVADTASASCWN